MKLKDITLVSGDGGLGGTSRLWRLSVLFSLISLVIYIIGFSTDWWCQLDNGDYPTVPGARINAHFGLWRKCISITVNGSSQSHDCTDMDNDDEYKPAAKTLSSLGLILCIFSLPISILAACGKSNRTMTFAATITIIGGAVAAIGAAVYAGKAKNDDDRLEVEYSTILALIGSILLALGGVFQLLTIRTGYLTLA